MKVVIIEHEQQSAEIVSMCLRLRWPDVTIVSARTGGKGLRILKAEPVDLVILGVDLPDIDSTAVLRRIRQLSSVPVIMLSSKADKMEAIKSLESGADDYMTKPFDNFEFLARVTAILRRAGISAAKENEVFQSGELSINFTTREVRLGKEVAKLTPTEYNLLASLARSAGRTVPHDTLLQTVWGQKYSEATDYLKVYIQRLRTKLSRKGNPEFIVTERKIGYKLVKSD